MFPWNWIPESTIFDTYLSERLQDNPGSDLPIPGYSLLDWMTGMPIRCCICDEFNHWLPEGIVFVCEHDPIPGVPCRILDSVRMEKVMVVNENFG